MKDLVTELALSLEQASIKFYGMRNLTPFELYKDMAEVAIDKLSKLETNQGEDNDTD